MQSRPNGYRARSKNQDAHDKGFTDDHYSKVTAALGDSTINHRLERRQTTQNKATFVQPTEELIPLADQGFQTQKANGQALFMYSRPKIKQFFQNLSSNTSAANLLAGAKQQSEGEQGKSFSAKHSGLLGSRPSRMPKTDARSHDRCKRQQEQSANHVSIPFKLLMSNFRRKMIIETLQDQQSSQEEKNQILNPYQEYLKTQSELIEEGKDR